MSMLSVLPKSLITAILSGLLLGFPVVQAADDSQEKSDQAATKRSTLISATQVIRKDVEVKLSSVGRLQSILSPTVATEVSGRVLGTRVNSGDEVRAGDTLLTLDTTIVELNKNAALADIDSLKIQIANEERRVERFRSLKKKDYLASTQLDDSIAQVRVLRSQLKAAYARLEVINDQLKKAALISPVDGVIDERMVSTGDFVKVGTPAFTIINNVKLRAHLPLPEGVAARLSKGQPVHLSSPLAPGVSVDARITELRPVVGNGSRAVTAIVDLENPGTWRPDGTVIGIITVETREGAMIVPETSIVRRPTGPVVYVIEGDRVVQKSVELGLRTPEGIEVTGELSGDERIAEDGAAFLVDGAAIRLAEAN